MGIAVHLEVGLAKLDSLSSSGEYHRDLNPVPGWHFRSHSLKMRATDELQGKRKIKYWGKVKEGQHVNFSCFRAHCER